ncbi:hypothetical protein PRZ48_011159 [Zasmidium cellare]|uniref:Uncharacterized protein n=1 Tax=Zasmidium cellare TaxID=395010 RepID=A0ABR0EB64_ZASCE|nr:hypothetical protein PRZ48_011159 [Zasmidium cellare]
MDVAYLATTYDVPDTELRALHRHEAPTIESGIRGFGTMMSGGREAANRGGAREHRQGFRDRRWSWEQRQIIRDQSEGPEGRRVKAQKEVGIENTVKTSETKVKAQKEAPAPSARNRSSSRRAGQRTPARDAKS